jgi:alkylation response protein AidB-like acyl-CoA dehydrogenase
MDLQYDTEQTILRDSAEKFLSGRYDYRTYQKTADSEAGWNQDFWREIAELGWLGLPFAEEDGGFGAGAVEIAILMEAFGKSLVLEPYLPTIVLGGGLVSKLGAPTQRQEILGPIVEGKSRLAFAMQDHGKPTEAKKSANGFTLSGAKKMVLGAPMADSLLVSAKIGNGVGVFVVPAATRGITIRGYRTVDGGRAADIELVDVAVAGSALLGGNEKAGDAIEEVVHRAIAAISSDAVGAMSALVAATVEYSKTRVQFGQPLAKFQVLQHRMVGMKVKEEEARASCLFATLSLDGSADRRTRAVVGAKAKIGRASRSVAQEAIQIHGAIGTTDELSVGGYVKRLLSYEMNFGTTREHLRRYGAIISDPDTASQGLLIATAQ